MKKELKIDLSVYRVDNICNLNGDTINSCQDCIYNTEYENVNGVCMRKKIWKVPVVWEMFGNVEVEAKSLEEAIKMVQRDEDAEGNPFSLPTEDYYIEDSFRVEFTNDELEDLNYE